MGGLDRRLTAPFYRCTGRGAKWSVRATEWRTGTRRAPWRAPMARTRTVGEGKRGWAGAGGTLGDRAGWEGFCRAWLSEQVSCNVSW
jgi:hypothetical protein